MKTIIGAAQLSATNAGYCFAIGQNTYMVVGNPETVTRLASIMAEHVYHLGFQQTPRDDDRMGTATVGMGGGSGSEYITGPGNAIAAIRKILLG